MKSFATTCLMAAASSALMLQQEPSDLLEEFEAAFENGTLPDFEQIADSEESKSDEVLE